MDVKTFRARSMQEALRRIRSELGPDAAVLDTREVRGGVWRRLFGPREIEVTASATVNVPSRFGELEPSSERLARGLGRELAADRRAAAASRAGESIPPVHQQDFRAAFRDSLAESGYDLQSLADHVGPSPRGVPPSSHALPACLFRLFTDLIDADVTEDLARELVDHVRQGAAPEDLDDPLLLKARMARRIEDEIRVSGPIRLTTNERRLVALVGPTGVGKTTTIAKLAADFHLRQRRRVGLITVDTYRIAAVEQLRTYADIIDLPMEVVSTPKEMREAARRLSDLELILMDTAGRSPRDDVKIQELKSMLTEARADEVHLVLSSVASVSSLQRTASRFREVGVTSLLLTKLDEATGLGSLVPLLRSSQLPLSYVTNGQNVPDDIEPADRRQLARIVLGIECHA